MSMRTLRYEWGTTHFKLLRFRVRTDRRAKVVAILRRMLRRRSMYHGDMVLITRFGVDAPVMTTNGPSKSIEMYIRLDLKTIIKLRNGYELSDTDLEKIYPSVDLKYMVRQIINSCC